MGDDLVMRLNALADARHDDLDVAAEGAQRIISITLQLMEAQDQIDALQQKVHLCAGYDALQAENERLRAGLLKPETLQTLQMCEARATRMMRGESAGIGPIVSVLRDILRETGVTTSRSPAAGSE